MVILKSPWQFGERSSDENDVYFPQLRIEHPQSRLGNPDDLNLRGVSRMSTARRDSMMPFKDILPDISENIPVHISNDRSKVNIPIFGNAEKLMSRLESRAPSVSTITSTDGASSSRISTSEIVRMLKDKMKVGYFSAKNLFKSYDPEGRGSVTREALHRILCTFLAMRISISQFNRVMRRLNFENEKTVNFEKFYIFFKQKSEETRSNEYPTWFNQEEENTDQQTASYIHYQLKQQAEKGFESLLTSLELDDADFIIKPVFLDRLKKMGYHATQKEFEKLWQKYDRKNTGTVRVNVLRHCLLSKEVEQLNSDSRLSLDAPSEREVSLNIERWLARSFQNGYRDIYFAFQEYEQDGMVTRAEFLAVLADYGLILDDLLLDTFLQRCNVPSGARINYKLFLKAFQQKDLKDMASGKTKVRKNALSVKTDLTTIEVELMDLLRGDLMRFSKKLKTIDHRNRGFVSVIEFQAALESFFNIKIKKDQFLKFMKSVPTDTEGNVKYQQFLSHFHESPKSFFSDTTSSLDEREFTWKTTPLPGTNNLREQTQRERNVEELTMLIKNLFKSKFQDLEKAFHEIDAKNTKRMTKHVMITLLQRNGVYLSMTEADSLWKTFIVDQRGTVEFVYFTRHFGYSLKSAAFPNSKKHPPLRGDSDFRILSQRFNSWRELIQDFAKTSIDKNYENLLKEFHSKDQNRNGYVSKSDFMNILSKVCHEINPKEAELLTERLTSNDRQVNWKELMAYARQPKQTSRTGHDMKDILKHPQLDLGMSTIPENPEKGLPNIDSRLREKFSSGKWKDLRRAFQQYDQSSSYLSVDEFRNLLKFCSIALTQNEMYQLLSNVDQDRYGKYNINDFRAFIDKF